MLKNIKETLWFTGAVCVYIAIIVGVEQPGDCFGLSSEDCSQLQALKEGYKRPDSIPFPPHNPYNDAKYQLGKMLFFDPRLSVDKTVSCATCHRPDKYWLDGLPASPQRDGRVTPNRSMSLLNIAWDKYYLWALPTMKTLELQATEPIQTPTTMNHNADKIAYELFFIPEYAELFRKAFADTEVEEFTYSGYVNKDTIAAALATFQRTLVSGQAPFDGWINGQEDAISPQAKQGFMLFNGKAKCATCHEGWRFSDGNFYDIGINAGDLGLMLFFMGQPLKNLKEYGFQLDKITAAYKAVGLRNIADRPPYFHDGSLKTLAEVIEFYDRGGNLKKRRPSLMIEPLNLTDAEKAALLAFLHSLSSDDPVMQPPELPE